MTTVGEILLAARLKRRLTIAQAERATRIRAKFIEAMEKNEFEKLPPGTFAKGFIKNYASYLGLSPDDTLAFYRRQYGEEKAKVLPDTRSTPKRGFRLTPQFITIVSIASLVLVFIAYLAYSYLRIAGSPSLMVETPKNNLVVNVSEIEVAGKTTPDAVVAINEQQVSVDENGNFRTKLPLQPGLNTITIKATNRFMRESVVTRNLRLEQ